MSHLNIDKIIKAIEDKTNFDDDLDDLNVDILTYDEVDYVLFVMLDNAYDYNNEDAAVIIIEYFEERRILVDPLPSLLMLFLNTYMNVNLLRWVTSLFPHKTGAGYYYDLINANGMDESTVQIAKSLLNIFPDVTDDEWQQLLDLTGSNDEYEYENILLREFFRAQTGNFSVKPEWIVKNDTNSVTNFKLEFDKIMMEVNANSNSNVDLNLNDFDDSSIFRKYGPVNSCYQGKLIAEDHECVKYGGCRMLLCKEYGDFDLTAEETYLSDWFTGKCDQCEKKIKFRNYCVRLPLYNGGWKGCYCSFPCMQKEITNSDVGNIVGKIRIQLLAIGINEI